MLKLSQAQTGKHYKIEKLTQFKSLSKRLAILGLNTGVFIQILSLYKHGAVIKTKLGDIAIGADILDSILVTVV